MKFDLFAAASEMIFFKMMTPFSRWKEIGVFEESVQNGHYSVGKMADIH